MKIIFLLLAIVFIFIGILKKTADDLKEITVRTEMRQYPNLLPQVEVIAKRLPRS